MTYPTARNNREGSPAPAVKRNSIKAQKKLLCPKYLFLPGDQKQTEKKPLFDHMSLQVKKKKTLPALSKNLAGVRTPTKQLGKLLPSKNKRPELKQNPRPQSKSKSTKPRKKAKVAVNLKKAASPDLRNTKKSIERMTVPLLEDSAQSKQVKRFQFLSPNRTTNKELGKRL